MNHQTVRVGLIGAGRMGSFHAENLAWRVPGATLAAVADPFPARRKSSPAGLGSAKRTAICMRCCRMMKLTPLRLRLLPGHMQSG